MKIDRAVRRRQKWVKSAQTPDLADRFPGRVRRWGLVLVLGLDLNLGKIRIISGQLQIKMKADPEAVQLAQNLPQPFQLIARGTLHQLA